jgi:hypothetical protein
MGLMDFFLPLRARDRALTCAGVPLSVLFLCGAQCFHPASLQQEAEKLEAPVAFSADRIEIISLSSDRIRGRLIQGDSGIIFDSIKNDVTAALVVKTLRGEELLSVREHEAGIVVTIGDERLSLEIDKEDLLNLRRAQTDGTLARLLQASPTELRARLLTFVEVRGNGEAVQSLQRIPEYALLPSVSWELGKLGITGRRFPPSLAIHAVGAAAAQALQIDPRQNGIVYAPRLPPEMGADGDSLAEVMGRAASDCWDRRSGLSNPRELPECPKQCEALPDPERACMGMCGRGCRDCWDWVCGDCCYHKFCAIHDAATRACEDVSDLGFCVIAVLPWYFVVLGCE